MDTNVGRICTRWVHMRSKRCAAPVCKKVHGPSRLLHDVPSIFPMLINTGWAGSRWTRKLTWRIWTTMPRSQRCTPTCAPGDTQVSNGYERLNEHEKQ